MADPTPTPVPQSLIVELIKSISDNTDELHKLRSDVRVLAEEKRALARDVACMSRGITQFRADFEPYLKRAVNQEHVWQERRRNWTTMIIGSAILSACAVIVYALGDYAVQKVAERMAQK